MQRLERIQLFCLTALCFFLPWAHMTGLRNTLSGLLAITLVAVLVRTRQLQVPSPWLGAWIVVCMCSSIWSAYPGLTLGDALTNVLLSGACGVASAGCVTTPRSARQVLSMLAAGLLAILLIRLGYLQLPQPAPDWAEKVYAYWPGRGVMSTLAILCLPAAMWLIATQQRALGGALLVMALIAGAQNWNRMFWVAAFVTLLPGLSMFKLQRQQRLLVGVLVALAIGAGSYVSLKALRPQLDGGAVVSATVKEDPRWAIWQGWGQLATERPGLGIGYGLRTTALIGAPRMPESYGEGIYHPHNIFLSILVQTGALGLAIYLVLLGDLTRRFMRVARGSSGTSQRAAGLAGMATVIGLVSKNLTDDFNYFSVTVLFWILIGIFCRLSGMFDEASNA